jgi:hypothetical protein
MKLIEEPERLSEIKEDISCILQFPDLPDKQAELLKIIEGLNEPARVIASKFLPWKRWRLKGDTEKCVIPVGTTETNVSTETEHTVVLIIYVVFRMQGYLGYFTKGYADDNIEEIPESDSALWRKNIDDFLQKPVSSEPVVSEASSSKPASSEPVVSEKAEVKSTA